MLLVEVGSEIVAIGGLLGEVQRWVRARVRVGVNEMR